VMEVMHESAFSIPTPFSPERSATADEGAPISALPVGAFWAPRARSCTPCAFCRRRRRCSFVRAPPARRSRALGRAAPCSRALARGQEAEREERASPDIRFCSREGSIVLRAITLLVRRSLTPSVGLRQVASLLSAHRGRANSMGQGSGVLTFFGTSGCALKQPAGAARRRRRGAWRASGVRETGGSSPCRPGSGALPPLPCS
jgi:hypothetical protein